jgi:glycosyltransferase involved in cell wall biosynthesis
MSDSIYTGAASVVLVGALPPPIGGVAVHVSRLAHALSGAAWRVEVCNTAMQPAGPEWVNGCRVWSGGRASNTLRLARTLAKSTGLVAHWHVSPTGRTIPELMTMAMMMRLAPSILTIHTGSFSDTMRTATAATVRAVRGVCNACFAVVAVSADIQATLDDLDVRPRGGVHVIPPYVAQAAPPLPPRRASAGPKQVISSGYANAIYGWDLIAQVIASDNVGEWHWVTYTEWDEAYMRPLIAAAERVAPGKLRLHRDLPPAAFNRLLAASDVYVRPTRADGDSIAVREALDLGVAVVASDVVTRPRGCALFPSGDPGDLAAAIAQAVPHVDTDPKPSYAAAVIDLYRAALTGRKRS